MPLLSGPAAVGITPPAAVSPALSIPGVGRRDRPAPTPLVRWARLAMLDHDLAEVLANLKGHHRVADDADVAWHLARAIVALHQAGRRAEQLLEGLAAQVDEATR